MKAKKSEKFGSIDESKWRHLCKIVAALRGQAVGGVLVTGSAGAAWNCVCANVSSLRGASAREAPRRAQHA